ICHPGFSTRQVEGLQGKCLIWRKVAFHFPPLFVRSVLGSGAWRFQRDLGGMKSPILAPGFGNGQETDCTGVCRPFQRVKIRVLGSTLADRESGGLHQGEVEAKSGKELLGSSYVLVASCVVCRSQT
ncbi:unnamed protein product, partial [Staurois parvus]